MPWPVLVECCSVDSDTALPGLTFLLVLPSESWVLEQHLHRQRRRAREIWGTYP